MTVFLVNTLGPLPVQAQEIYLPKPGVRVGLSPQFNPPVLKGLKVHPDNPFRFDFILDKGDVETQHAASLQDESIKLIKYFLASLTAPEKDLWVNLSPYEKDRIVPESFGQTEMGRDLLAQDYLLKQITASLIYPEDDFGKKFWNRIYQEAQAKYHTTNIPINTFNKVWIVPEKAVVYENAQAGTAYVVESRLKVMLEEDYLALEHSSQGRVLSSVTPIVLVPARDGGPPPRPPAPRQDINALGSQIVREIVIPELTKEVNENKNFAQLRQVYNSLILATWYKKKIKDSILSQVYADKNKIQGVNIQDPNQKQKIYEQYLIAFKKGVYNYIKEETDPITNQMIPRKYFSGGVKWDMAMLQTTTDRAMLPQVASDHAVIVQTNLNPVDQAMMTRRDFLRAAGRVAAAGAVLTALPSKVFGQSLENPTVAEIIHPYLGLFDKYANPVTGLVPSFLGGANKEKGVETYDTNLRIMVDPTGINATKALNTYFQNNSRTASEDSPLIFDGQYIPRGGMFRHARILDFNEPNWWERWSWEVDPSSSAWSGNAALRRYAATPQYGQLLEFARQRADFILALQDPQDGGVRAGPQGQYHPEGPLTFWNMKVTEQNVSALSFLDNLAAATGEEKYKKVADDIYRWLMDKMYDVDRNIFRTAMRYQNGAWVEAGVFATDTTSWAPMERMSNDQYFGRTRLERLQKLEDMMRRTEELTGVKVNGKLKGMSFSEYSKMRDVISIEWTSQFAVRYWRIAQEYARLGDDQIDQGSRERAVKENMDKYKSLITVVGSYFKQTGDGFLVSPYAVYANGDEAFDETTGHSWNTPGRGTYASVASGAYYVLAKTIEQTGFDPVAVNVRMPARPDQAMSITANKQSGPGGIDFKPDKVDSAFVVKNSGGAIKFHIDPAMLQQLQNAPGFVPVIINIVPLKDLPEFLGLKSATDTATTG